MLKISSCLLLLIWKEFIQNFLLLYILFSGDRQIVIPQTLFSMNKFILDKIWMQTTQNYYL